MTNKPDKSDKSIEAAIATLEAKKAAYCAQIDNAIATLRGIDGPSGIPSISPTTLKKTTHLEIKSYTFYGKSFIEAAMQYLDSLDKEPQKTKDIIATVKKGGIKVDDNSAEVMLRKRASKKGDLVRVGRGEWGLKKWFSS